MLVVVLPFLDRKAAFEKAATVPGSRSTSYWLYTHILYLLGHYTSLKVHIARGSYEYMGLGLGLGLLTVSSSNICNIRERVKHTSTGVQEAMMTEGERL